MVPAMRLLATGDPLSRDTGGLLRELGGQAGISSDGLLHDEEGSRSSGGSDGALEYAQIRSDSDGGGGGGGSDRSDPRIVAGESGVAGLVGVLGAAADPSLARALGLGAESRVLVFGSEGATDPELWRRLVEC